MADLPLSPTPTAVRPAAKPATAPKPHPRDSIREMAETVVFVVALVLMLKLFVVEAFVIPTGSMAESLYGYQKIADCPECGFRFPINASNEVEPQEGQRVVVVGGCCPNCRHRFTWNPDPSNPNAPTYRSGDRVLVHKALYHFEPPERGDVVVFKFPVDPQVKQTAQNYIKRLWGRGTETIGINRGDLYQTTALKYDPAATYPDADPVPEAFRGKPKYPRPDNPAHLWERGPNVGYPVSKTSPPFEPDGPDFTYHNADDALILFEKSRRADFADPAGGFDLIRKSNALALATRRIVYDNDHQAKSVAALGLPPRWTADAATGWTPDAPAAPRSFAHAGDQLGWVRYQHRNTDPASPEVAEKLRDGQRAEAFPPGHVTNFMGYNSSEDAPLNRAGRLEPGPNGGFITNRTRETTEFWVGDLMLECSATFQTADAELVLELSKGQHRYQAVFAGGTVRLVRTGPQGKELATRPSPITAPGTYALRFANVDCRLRVWVNETALDFGTDADYPPDPVPEKFDPADRMQEGWTQANDVAAPASVGAKGGVQVSKLVIWRDTYFTSYGDGGHSKESDVARYVDTFFVQPGHYMCLGDNSAQSSDSRTWGTVPERLLLGKAVFVFFPVNRIGLIR